MKVRSRRISPRKRLGDVLGVLSRTQLAPPGFLAVEWVAVRTLGDTPLGLEVVPARSAASPRCSCSYGVAARCLRPRAVWIALGLFAVSDDLIYFAVGVEAVFDGRRRGPGVPTSWGWRWRRGRRRSRVPAPCAAAGAAAVWFSHAVGVRPRGRRDRPAGVRAGRREHGGGPSSVPSSVLLLGGELRRRLCRIPRAIGPSAGHVGLLGLRLPADAPRVALGSHLVGSQVPVPVRQPLEFRDAPGAERSPPCRRWASSSPGACRSGGGIGPVFGMLALPGLFALLAACLRLYPFHGRLVLFLVPSLLAAHRRGGRVVPRDDRGGRDLGGRAGDAVPLPEPLGALNHLVEPRRSRGSSARYGDRRPAKLDPYRFPVLNLAPSQATRMLPSRRGGT